MTLLRDISFLWSMLHVVVLFLLLFEPRRGWRSTVLASLAGVLAMLAASALLMAWKGSGVVTRAGFFTCTIPSALLLFCLSQYRDGRFFFLFCLTGAASCWILQVTDLLDRLAGNTGVVMFAARLLLFPLAEWLVWRHLRQPCLTLLQGRDRGWWPLAALGGVYALLLLTTCVPAGAAMPDAVGLCRILLVLLLMPLIYLTALRPLRQQTAAGQDQAELELLSTRSRLALENLRIVQESSAELAQARHDILGNLGILQTLCKQGAYDKLEEYLARITQKTSRIVPLRMTPHPIVNAILTQGAERAQKHGVSFRRQVTLPAALPIPDEDLVAFLMNLLDNALDAAEETPGDRPRWVEITMHIRGRYLFIEGRNTYGEAPEPGKNGTRYRARRGTGQGYGLRIMESVARRYESELHTEAKDGVFTARTALLLPQTAE